MSKRIYQKNLGREDDWILEGALAIGDLEELGRKQKTDSLSFRSITSLPERPFRHLKLMRMLKHLVFQLCPLTTDDLADFGALPKLKSLWIEDSSVTDDGVACLAKHPKLWQVVLSRTRITDASLEYLATIPKLQWLWLDGTSVTDRGLAHLRSATSLNSLALRNTAVTDQGILQLAVLPKLNLASGYVTGTSVTEQGLDALVQERKRLKKSTQTGRKDAKPPAAQAVVELNLAEIDAAKQVLYAFFKTMHDWQTTYARRYEELAASFTGNPNLVVPGSDALFQACQADCQKIFAEFCTQKVRAYGRPENVSIGSPPDYEADPEMEPINSVEMPSGRKLVIETKQQFVVKYRCQYVLLKKGDRWLIDSKKVWRNGWEWTIL